MKSPREIAEELVNTCDQEVGFPLTYDSALNYCESAIRQAQLEVIEEILSSNCCCEMHIAELAKKIEGEK